MRLTKPTIGGFLILASLVAGVAAAQQGTSSTEIVRSIDVNNARPVLRAVETLRERYHLSITYEEPRYVFAQDLQDISYMHRGPVTGGAKLTGPRRGAIHFTYAEAGGSPCENIKSLLRRLVTEYASQGGPVFDVRERTTPDGLQWNVVASKARNENGTFVDQPDILGVPVFIPKARRSKADFLSEMLQQLRIETGYRVVLGTTETSTNAVELGADSAPARDVLVGLYGTSTVWDLNYDPEGEGAYVLSLLPTPQPPRSPNPHSLPPTPQVQPTGPAHLPMGAAMRMARTRGGIRHIQSILAQAGYYSGEPSGEWDAKTSDALKKFQGAAKIAVTGQLDPETVRKLGLDVVSPSHSSHIAEPQRARSV
jgi:hypothetical protein